MKPIVMTKEAEINLAKAFFEKFHKELENFKFNMNDSKFSMSMDISQIANEKVTILFTQNAYVKMQSLVDYFSSEVAWYGLVDKIEDKLYRVYDVRMCKQYVNGAKVDTEDEDTLEFFDSLSDEEIEHMHFQAHSHVNMSTGASGVDLQNQADVIRNMGKTGFYIFQIWNKSNDINTYLYDLDNNTFYDNKDVIIDIETEDGFISDFLAEANSLVETKKYPYQEKKSKKKEEEKEPAYLPGYYGYCGGYYEDRYDV